MSEDNLRRAVLRALTGVRHPITGRDIIESGHVQGVEVAEGGDVRVSVALKSDDPRDLVRETRGAVEAVRGVARVKVNVQLPQTTVQAPRAAGSGRLQQTAPQAPPPAAGGGRLQPGSVPAPTPKQGLLADVAHIVAVSSGKGGVGKSMVATNLAAALAAQGRPVGLLDADIYGPNIPLMFGEHRRPPVTGSKGQEMIAPLEAHGVRLMSLGFLLEKEQPAIMRGPLISGILRQFLEQVSWGPLDVLVVDMPPGTGDAQLSLVQTIDLGGVVMVSTPQDVATGDVRRGVKMFERVNTQVLGIVENMAALCCPHCGEEVDVFGTGGVERLTRELQLPLLGRVPLDPRVREAGDRGLPSVLSAPDSAAGRALRDIAEVVMEKLGAPVRA